MRRPTVALWFASVFAAQALVAQAPSTDVAVSEFPFLVGNMDSRIAEIVSNCQTYGIDTFYISAYRATGPSVGDLWITDSAGDWNAAWGPVRPTGAGINMQNLITACHAANIRVVAVLKCFADTVQPTDAAHKQYLLGVIDYFVDAWRIDGTPVYDLDGLALDYIRFVGSGTGNDPLQVTNFLAQVRQHIGALSLHCYLIASRFTFDGPTYDGNFASYTSVINSFASQYGQHWQQMAAYVDVMMPMAYTADGSIYSTAALHRAYVQQTALYARQACTLAGVPNRRVCPAVRTYVEAPETCTDATVDASITGALLGGANGYQSFRYQHLVNNPTWWTRMQAHAVAGCNWPEPSATTFSPTLNVRFDPSASRDSDQTTASLQARFDWNGDAAFDTAWLPLAATDGAPRHPGTWIGTMQVRDNDGHVSTTRRRYVAGPGLTLVPPFVSAAAGGAVTMQIRTGVASAGLTYALAPTLSGTQPGFEWQPGFPVPINPDFLTDLFLSNPGNPLLPAGFGVLDALGSADAVLTVPPGLITILAGTSMHWTFGVMDAAAHPVCVGEADSLLILN